MDPAGDQLVEPLGRRLVEPKDRLVSDLGEMSFDAVPTAKVIDEPLAGSGSHRLDANGDPTTVLTSPSQVESAVVLVPDRESKRTQRLEVCLGEVLSAVLVHPPTQFMQLWQWGAIPEGGSTRIDPIGASDVLEERDLPVQICELIDTVPETKLHSTRRGTSLSCKRQAAITKQTSANDIELEVAQQTRLRHHDRNA